METLKSKIYIEGTIKTVTGLHIGGSKTTLDIGGSENNIIKTSQGVPYIPGSSLKGKLRNMLARVAGSKEVKEDPRKTDKIKYIAELFGMPAEESKGSGRTEALLKVYDSFLENPDEVKKRNLELTYSEVKMENQIDRLTSKAMPRPLERVPENVDFKFIMVLDEWDAIKTEGMLKELCFSMQLLEYDHLGGSGSRGSGRIKFSGVKCIKKTIDTTDFNVKDGECEHTKIFKILEK